MPRPENWPRTILHVDLDAFYTSVHQRDDPYIDVTARPRHGTSTPDEVARRIKFQVHTEVGLTASVGAATSKLLAKVASGTRKPDGLVLVPPSTEADFLAPLPIGAIPGLGPKTEERLHAMGVRTVGELAAYETQRLVQSLGVGGAVLQRMAQGRDRAPVDGSKPPQTISAQTTFEKDVRASGQLEAALRELTDRVVERLVAEGVRARTIYVKLKLPDFRLVSRQVSRTSPTDDVETIFRAARSALEKSHVESRPVRLIGVGLSGLEHPEPDLQMTLFD